MRIKLQAEYFLFFLLALWATSFAAKGALFQLALYAFPMFILALPKFRTVMVTILRLDGIKLGVLLLIPGIVTVTVLAMTGQTVDMKSTSDLFGVFWRLIIFPAAVAAFFSVQSDLRTWILPGLTLIPLGYAASGFIEVFNAGGKFSAIGRIKGVMGNENGFGFIMGSGMLITLGSLLRKSAHLSRFHFVLILTPMTCIPFWVFSGSRGAWISTTIAISLISVLHVNKLRSPKFRNWTLVGVVLACALTMAIFFNSPLFTDRLSRLFSHPVRTQIWNHYLSLLDDHWWLGLSGYYQRLCLLPSKPPLGPHNIYLDALVRYGILGLAGWLTCFGWLVVRLKKNCWQSGYGKLAISGLVMILTAGFVDYSTYRDPILQAPLAMVIAVAFSHVSKIPE